MAFGIVSVVLLIWTTIVAADDLNYLTPYNNNCPDLARSLGSGCTIDDGCTKISCTDNSLGDKKLTLTIKLNKCDGPPTIDVTVEALGFSWSHTFKSDERIAVPGLSIKPAGKLFSAGVYVKVVLEDSGSNLKLKIIILTGIELLGSFKQLSSSTLADSDLRISTYECGIVRWWNSLSVIFKVLVIGGGLGFIALVVGIFCCICCGCCRSKSNNGTVMVAPQVAATVTPANTNVPMQAFVINERM